MTLSVQNVSKTSAFVTGKCRLKVKSVLIRVGTLTFFKPNFQILAFFLAWLASKNWFGILAFFWLNIDHWNKIAKISEFLSDSVVKNSNLTKVITRCKTTIYSTPLTAQRGIGDWNWQTAWQSQAYLHFFPPNCARNCVLAVFVPNTCIVKLLIIIININFKRNKQ